MANKRILIIEHNEKNLETLSGLLEKNGYDVFTIKSKYELLKLDEVGEVCLFLVSSHINFITVEDVLGQIEYHFSAQHPVMFIDSAKEYDKGTLVECFKYGGVDYIKSPFDSREIMFRINFHVAQFVKITEYKLRIDKLIGLATTDQLSKFSSKMHIRAILKHTIEVNDRYPSDNTVLYLRLSEIERVVSTFGFEYGEKLIASFSKVLKKQLRESDVVGRWAGADFIILLPYTEEHIADDVAKKLYTNLTKTEIMKDIRPSLSIGATEILKGDTVDSILEKAKHAMSEASKDRYDRISRN